MEKLGSDSITLIVYGRPKGDAGIQAFQGIGIDVKLSWLGTFGKAERGGGQVV